MIHDSYLFDFQGIVEDIRDQAKESEDEKKKAVLMPVLDAITDVTELEDLSVYEEYLSAFDVSNDLGDLELHCPNDLEDCRADFVTLLQLVAASFSCDYDLEYDNETHSVDLIINVVDSEGGIVSEKVHELWMYQIAKIIYIYLEEMLISEGMRRQSDSGKENVDKSRKERLVAYQKKIRQLKSKIDSGDIKDMDDLLEV